MIKISSQARCSSFESNFKKPSKKALMDFSKIPHPVNFEFSHGFLKADSLSHCGNGIFRLQIPMKRNAPRTFELGKEAFCETRDQKKVQPKIQISKGNLKVFSADKRILLKGDPKGPVGTCKDTWILRFEPDPELKFYGLGERSGKFERTGTRAQMWNVDAWGAHGTVKCRDDEPDPLYANVPFLLVRRKQDFLGILVNDAGRVFFSLSPDMRLHPSQEPVKDSSLYFGSTCGPIDVLFITGNSAEEILQKLGKLAGPFHVPPLWALGYHQSRWGYAGTEDLEELDREMSKRKIPCDGFFLDIDYMDRYKVFTTNPETFADPESETAKLLGRGRHVVPILDPGVRDESYPIRNEGIKQDIFCKNPNGKPYRGFVWPGATLFPDFSTEKGRSWWAAHVAKLARKGFYGFWIDMNDPSTGSVSDDEMLFDSGKKDHESFHNLYANGMAKATFDGLTAAHPGESPFVLSRSASFGMGRYAGVWLGDNFSTWKSLKESIPMALGLSISGIPFVGADIGGFGEDSSAELLARWVEAAVLFPFFRIHSSKNCKRQEPWKFGKECEARVKNAIEFRYKMRPILYKLFKESRDTGAPVMRPLFYLGDDSAKISDQRLEDEYLIGNNLLVAPILEAKATERLVELPCGTWKNLSTGKLYSGKFCYSPEKGELPVFEQQV